MEQYLPLLGLLALAAVFAEVSLLASRLLAPRRPTVPKQAPYECGVEPARDAPERMPVRFFLVAMAFIVFDVEIILFYPYAVARGGLGVFGLVVLGVFTFAVFESFVYLIGAGALNWGPESASPPIALPIGAATPSVRQSATADPGSSTGINSSTAGEAPMLSACRTVATTIRRVGLEGRNLQLTETTPTDGETAPDGNELSTIHETAPDGNELSTIHETAQAGEGRT